MGISTRIRNTNVYDVDLSSSYSDSSTAPWHAKASNITSVSFDSSFKDAQPKSTAYWFYGLSKCEKKYTENLDTSNVTDMSGMFRDCKNLTDVDVSGFDTSKCTSMKDMFRYCSKVTELDVAEFDTAKVTTMNAMFYDCSSVPEFDVAKWDTSSVTNMGGMFYNCKNSNVTKIDVSGFKTDKVTDMSEMFYKCSSITELDLSSFDTSNGTSYSNFATSCDALSRITIDDAFSLFEKSTSRLVSQQNWYDSKVNGTKVSSKYMIGINKAGTYYIQAKKVDFTISLVDEDSKALSGGEFTIKDKDGNELYFTEKNE